MVRSRLITNSRRRALQERGGYSLIELIAVMAIAGILAVVAVPALGALNERRTNVAARLLLQDLLDTRQYATSLGRTVWIEFDGMTEWRIRLEDPDQPGRASALPLVDAGTGREHVVILGSDPFQNVALTEVDFDLQPRIGFDWRGRPLTDDDVLLVETGGATFIGGVQVTVEPETGHARLLKP
ncbi:MAG: type II secretion system protein [Phycisphaerales bacterium]|nr:MAG: type II secretion system protein [Phycisphaerales bacterium]